MSWCSCGGYGCRGPRPVLMCHSRTLAEGSVTFHGMAIPDAKAWSRHSVLAMGGRLVWLSTAASVLVLLGSCARSDGPQTGTTASAVGETQGIAGSLLT